MFAGRCNQGNVLVYCCDGQNRHDPFAVATCKVIGHVCSNKTVCKTFTVLNENIIRVASELKLASS